MASGEKHRYMCEDCQRHVGAGRGAHPHGNLLRTGSMLVSYVIGTVEEEYYCCDDCGRQWLHEAGSVGMGWMS
jgi:transposase-like protein